MAESILAFLMFFMIAVFSFGFGFLIWEKLEENL